MSQAPEGQGRAVLLSKHTYMYKPKKAKRVMNRPKIAPGTGLS